MKRKDREDRNMSAKFLVLAAVFSACSLLSAQVTVTSTAGTTSTVANINAIDYNTGKAVDPAGIAAFSGSYDVFSGNVSGKAADPGGGGYYLAVEPGQTVTVTFSKPEDYVGLLWGSPDAYNTLVLYDGSKVLGTYTGAVTGKSATSGSSYMNFFAQSGYDITKIVMTSSSPAFETDNLTYQVADPVPDPVPGGDSVLIEGLLSGLICAAAPWLMRRGWKPSLLAV
jgi:hypothetical protein